MVVKARETVYQGITMRSRLEARFAEWLDNCYPRWTWEYEPRCYASAHGQYLVDFVVNATTLDGDATERLFVDVKPPPFQHEGGWRSYDALLDRMALIIKASEANALPVVATLTTPSSAHDGETWMFYRNGIDFNRLLDLYHRTEASACFSECWHKASVEGSYFDDELGRRVPFSYPDLKLGAGPSHPLHFGILTD